MARLIGIVEPTAQRSAPRLRLRTKLFAGLLGFVAVIVLVQFGASLLAVSHSVPRVDRGPTDHRLVLALFVGLAFALLAVLATGAVFGRPAQRLRAALAGLLNGWFARLARPARLTEVLNCTIERAETTHQPLSEAVIYDTDTGILVHANEFDRRLSQESARAARAGRPLSLLRFDIDRFEALVRAVGHPRAMDALREAAHIWREGVREGDVVSLYAGDEFAILLAGVTCSQAVAVAERLRVAVHAVNATLALPTDRSFTVSFGVSALDPAGYGPDEATRASKEALRRAKADGRDRVCVA